MNEPKRRIIMRQAADIADDVPTWAWTYGQHGRIAVGTLVLFAGRPGAGKSTFARWLVAEVTRGTLPGCWAGQPVSAAYIAREESVSYIVKPSMRAHNTDMSRVYFPEVEVSPDDPADASEPALIPVTVADMAALAEALIAHQVRIVVVDPLMSMIGSKTDAHRNNEVRGVLEPWSKLAEQIDGIVCGVAHLNKSGNGDVVAGINGSSAFGEVARGVFGFAKDPGSGDDERVLSQEKNSMGREDLALTYRIQPAMVTTDSGRTAEVGQFVILGDSDRSVGDVLRDSSRSGSDDGTEVDKARAWLATYLGAAVRDSGEAKKDGKAAGFSERTLQRARRELSVVIEPDGRRSTWRLPTCANTPPGREVGTGGTGGTGQEDAGHSGYESPKQPVPPVPRATPKEQLAPIGAPTTDTPGMTDRVTAILAKQRYSAPSCEECGRRVSSPTVTQCDECRRGGVA